MKKVKFGTLFGGLIFFVVGIMIAVVGFVADESNKEFMETAKETEGVISDIETYRSGSGKRRKTSHRAYVTYEVDGVRYEDIRLSYYSSSMRIGKKITLYYDPLNPTEVKVAGESKFVKIITLVMGSIFALVGFFIIFTSIKRTPKLKKIGTRYEGKVLSVDCNTSVRVNGRHPYKVTCRVENYSTGEAYIYKSKNVYLDLYQYNLETVPVYINPSNPAKFYVDVEEGIKNLINSTYDNGMAIREFE